MKKTIKTMLLTFIMVLTFAGSVFATNDVVKELERDLLAIGVPSNYMGNVIEYLQKNTITKNQYQTVDKYIKEAQKIIGNTKDLSKLPTASKIKLQDIAKNAGAVIGLNVEFSRNNSSQTTVSITDSNGATLLQLSTGDVVNLVTNFKINLIKKAIDSMYKFSNDPNKGEFIPTGGELTETATPYGNIILAGTAMMIAGAGVFVVSKKKFA